MATFDLWTKTQEYLEGKVGVKVYPISTKTGECQEDYLVLKDDMTAQYQNLSTQIEYYNVLCYSKTYTGVLSLVDKTRIALDAYSPNLHPTGVETPAYYDDSIRGYMISIQYRSMRRSKKVKQYI